MLHWASKAPLWWMVCLLGKQQAEINGAANNQNRPREVTTNHSRPREVTTNQSRSKEVTANQLQKGNQNRPREMTINHDIQSHSNSEKIAADTCRVQVKITGMSCSSCVNKIESTLSSKKGKIYVCYINLTMYYILSLIRCCDHIYSKPELRLPLCFVYVVHTV